MGLSRLLPVHVPRQALLAGGLLLLFVIVQMPLFVRMPLTNDTELFDLQASLLQDGGVLYRDMLEPNLPGVVWIHVAARAMFGSGTEAMRLFDLVMLASTVMLAGVWTRHAGGSWTAVLWTCCGLAACYLTASEWCHTQRDGWLLVPLLGGLNLRGLAVTTRARRSAGRIMLMAFAEGMIWGCGVWLKPYIVFPAAAAWLISQRLMPSRRGLWLELAGLIAGGLLIGAAGVGWMVWSGCWPHFLETMREWNPRYFAAGREHWTSRRFVGMVGRLSPWIWLHVPAVALSLISLARLVGTTFSLERQSSEEGGSGGNVDPRPVLYAAYLGSVAQAFWFQHLFDYVHLPVAMLAFLVVANAAAMVTIGMPRVRAAWCGFALLAVLMSPAVRLERLALWRACVMGPGTDALQDRLSRFQNPRRVDLARVADFLRSESVEGRDVCCYNSDLISLYRRIGCRTPVKATYFFETLQFFPDRKAALVQELQASSVRFVVTDLVSCGMPRDLAEEVGPDGPRMPPPAYRRAGRREYPWSLPVVFRAGTYLVHAANVPQEDALAAR